MASGPAAERMQLYDKKSARLLQFPEFSFTISHDVRGVMYAHQMFLRWEVRRWERIERDGTAGSVVLGW